MLSCPEFVEKSEYAFGVAKIRALETRLVDGSDIGTLLSTPVSRLPQALHETIGLQGIDASDQRLLLDHLEESFTRTLFLVKSLMLEDEMKRLAALKYDYELLKLVIKEEKGWKVIIPKEVSRRSNYSYPVLKSFLKAANVSDTGVVLYETFRSLMSSKQESGKQIDYACDCAYYRELFWIAAEYGNGFIEEYFRREVDTCNIVTTLRIRLRNGKRAQLRERVLPFGSIDISHLEYGLDLTLDGFASKIIFSPLSDSLLKVKKDTDPEEQVVQVEKVLEEELIRYLKETLFVTFGVEPVFAYLKMREIELQNLRTILIARSAGIESDEIKRHLRGAYG